MKSFFKVFFSIIFSVILVVTLWTFTTIQVTKNIINEKAIKEIISEAKVSGLLKNSDGTYNELGNSIKDELQEYGMTDEVIDEFISSEPIEEFFTDSLSNAVNYVFHDEEYEEISARDIETLVNDNIDDIVEKLRDEEIEGIEELTDERVNEIKTNVKEISEDIAESIPDLKKEFENSEIEIVLAICRFIFSNFVTYVLLGTIILLTGLMILINFKKARYTCWLAVVYIIVGFPITLVGGIFSITKFSENTVDIAINIFKNISTSLMTYGGAILGIGLAFAILGIILGSLKKKDKNININNNVNITKHEEVKEAVVDTVVPEKEEVTPITETTENIAQEEVKEESQEQEKLEEAKIEVTTHYCANCGSQVANTETFCANCGSNQNGI